MAKRYKKTTKTNKNKRGQPRKYKTPKEMQIAVDDYFIKTPELEQTVCGLSLHLGFAQRKSLLDYEGYEGDYCNIIKKAIQKLENIREKMLISGKNNPAGIIFWLKNHGWADKQTHEFSEDTLNALLNLIPDD